MSERTPKRDISSSSSSLRFDSSSSTRAATATAAAATASSSLAETLSSKLSKLESTRDAKRGQYELLFEQVQSLQKQMKSVEQELLELDDEILGTENRLRAASEAEQQSQDVSYDEEEIEARGGGGGGGIMEVSIEEETGLTILTQQQQQQQTQHQSLTCADDILTDPLTMRQTQMPSDDNDYDDESALEREIQSHYDEHEEYIPEEDIPDEHDDSPLRPNSSAGIGPLQIRHTSNSSSNNNSSSINHQQHRPNSVPQRAARPVGLSVTATSRTAKSNAATTDTLDSFLGLPPSGQTSTHRTPLVDIGRSVTTPQGPFSDMGRQHVSISGSSGSTTTMGARSPAIGVVSTSAYGSLQPQIALQRPTAQDRNAAYMQQLARDDFPWSQQMMEYLHNTFHIQNFRDHQKEIINCTMSGDDAFVIMRTGGGKSLTYQLPALLEGRGQEKKITLVVSPLLSLIHDQEVQMNQFAPGSATSFTSGLPGGSSEHARRWGLVRDRNSGVCLIFVTPEKVHKSGKLRSELEKLHEKKRLGRFVIDECHCATQWGHDFRPDYTKLGMLKNHFPTVPLIAVTATASDLVREDCCRILKLGSNYQFFRSTANRPNLRYSVREKPSEGRDKVVDDMADFIREHHSSSAGIVYTFSRKEADDVADKLCERGIVARSYHSSVSDSAKEHTHRSWMRNETQVVVATIAFGLGINKPDVRFVLHHSLSKSLESYYQESGRAGRDGEPADCVLYYSTRDVARMLQMIHGENGEAVFWSMVRYAQSHGNDAVCRALILDKMGEGILNMGSFERDSDETTEKRDVGKHAKTVVQLVHSLGKRDLLTQPQLVAAWRSRSGEHQCVKDNPPANDLNKDECERTIIALMLEDVLEPKVVFNAYGATMYIRLGRKGPMLLAAETPKVEIRFPHRKTRATPSKRTATASAKKAVSKDDGWITTRKKRPSVAARRKSDSAVRKRKSAPAPKSRSKTSKKTKSTKKTEASAKAKTDSSKIIELDLSSDDDSSIAEVGTPELEQKNGGLDKKKKRLKRIKDTFLDESSLSDEEFEF